MASLWSVIALVAGVTATTNLVAAQPIRSPHEVSDKATKAKQPTKTAKPPAKSTKTAKATKSTKKKSTKAKTKAKAKPKAAATAPSSARATAAPTRTASRGNNMPRGFEWPASAAMLAASKRCEQELDALGVTWKKAAPEGHMVDPVEVPDGMFGGIKYTSKWRPPPHKLDCQLARALAETGKELHALGVREVRWGSIYRWSNVRTQGTELPFLSRHALGLAMDIVEFVDSAGRVANVKADYLRDDSLLLGIESLVNTSGRFRLVLTPRNDPKSHYDHFHVEANPDYTAP